jgi:hypothetical protein
MNEAALLSVSCRERIAAALPNYRNNLAIAGSVPGKATVTAIFDGAEAAPRLVLTFRK